MPTLETYNQFEGRHPETGSIRNALAHQGVVAPHTGQPLSEAMLLGISGGVTVGYFTFQYQGFEPWLRVLTRWTFDPLDTIFERLALPVTAQRTANPAKAAAQLRAALDAGIPPLVWVDAYGLTYNDLPQRPGLSIVIPVVVYSDDMDLIYAADRARVPVVATSDEFAAARARSKTARHLLMTLGAPDFSRLPDAVEAGIRACLRLFCGEPPRGPRNSFGLPAYQTWADALTATKGAQAWAKRFPPGPAMLSILTSGYLYITRWGTDGLGGRAMYADFLDEASAVLGKPALREAAARFRQAAERWRDLTRALLDDSVPPFAEMRDLYDRQYELFLSGGTDSLPERRRHQARLDALEAALAADFPLDDRAARTYRERLAACVLAARDTEQAAVEALRAAMA